MSSYFNHPLLLQVRLDLDLSQEQAAESLGVNVRTYRRYESGAVNDSPAGFNVRQPRRRRLLRSIADEFGIPESDLIQEHPPPVRAAKRRSGEGSEVAWGAQADRIRTPDTTGNTAKPVEASLASLEPGAVPSEPRCTPEKGRQVQRPVVAAVVLLVVVGGVLTWPRPWESPEDPASMVRMAFPLPDRPSIAVLPFSNMSDEPRQEYFVDGITEDVTTDLSKLSGMFVIARTSTINTRGSG